jgi:hypothetical protein
MAILTRSRRIFNLDALVEGLQRVRRGVVRVDAGGGAVSTGWLVTPDLVVIPGYAVPTDAPADQITVRSVGRERNSWESGVSSPPEFLGSGHPDTLSESVALLRTKQPLTDAALSLRFATPDADQPIFLLHYPSGQQETAVSVGRIVSTDDKVVQHDADTEPGSSGGPLLDKDWRVTAMHVGRGADQKFNRATALPAILDALRTSAHWQEIAAFHRIADLQAAQSQAPAAAPPQQQASPVDPILVYAAATRLIDPKPLNAIEQDGLRQHVVDPDAPQWVLRAASRDLIIRAVGSRDALKAARAGAPAPDTAQRVIDRVLDGPPYDLANESDESLSWWIQAARWFAPVEPTLPKPADITIELERRRVRGRLKRLTGPTFFGRRDELGYLRDWFARPGGPLVVTGIGGIGKSALVAEFALGLSGNPLLLWLDFDRADLAPDDASSVLSALRAQAAVQTRGFEGTPKPGVPWKEAAQEFGKQLQAATAGRPSLLVLDSFEAAQYTEQYQELWPVLEEIVGAVKELRVIVTGRAPVEGLTLAGRTAISKHLEGLKNEDASRWLKDHHIADPAVLQSALALANGIPLILRLAVLFIESGGSIAELPAKLPQEIVVGFLYDRILGRVNPTFKSVAHAALVLRRLTIRMVDPVLKGVVELPPGEKEEWFADFANEVALLEGTTELRLRPEVRSATLRLLIRDNDPLVRTIDQKAAAFYEGEDLTDPENVADLVYHRLRLGDIAGASQAWRPECADFLSFASDDFVEPAKSWLIERVGSPARPSLGSWERLANERIKTSRARGLDRNVGSILNERPERSEASPLVFQNAFELKADGNLDGAKQLLSSSGRASGPIARDRAVLSALLASKAGDRYAADDFLCQVDGDEHWTDRRQGRLELLAVRAARIRLTVDVSAEAALQQQTSDLAIARSLATALSPIDVVFPRAQARLRGVMPRFDDLKLESIVVDELLSMNSQVAARIETERRRTLEMEPPYLRSERDRLVAAWSAGQSWQQARLGTPPPFPDPSAMRVAEGGWRRGWLSAASSFVGETFKLLSNPQASGPLVAAVFGTFALLVRGFGNVRFSASQSPSIDDILLRNRLVRDLLERPDVNPNPLLEAGEMLAQRPADFALVSLFLATPDPLDPLVDTLAGVAERVQSSAAYPTPK